MEQLSISDMIALERHSNLICHEIEAMIRKAPKEQKPLLQQGFDNWKRKNIVMQMMIYDAIPDKK